MGRVAKAVTCLNFHGLFAGAKRETRFTIKQVAIDVAKNMRTGELINRFESTDIVHFTSRRSRLGPPGRG